MEPESLDDTVPARERDNWLSTHIARARETAERARAGSARSDIRHRVGGVWVGIEDPVAKPHSWATRDEDQP